MAELDLEELRRLVKSGREKRAKSIEEVGLAQTEWISLSSYRHTTWTGDLGIPLAQGEAILAALERASELRDEAAIAWQQRAERLEEQRDQAWQRLKKHCAALADDGGMSEPVKPSKLTDEDLAHLDDVWRRFLEDPAYNDLGKLNLVAYLGERYPAIRSHIAWQADHAERLGKAAREVAYEIERMETLSEVPQLGQIAWWRGMLRAALEEE